MSARRHNSIDGLVLRFFSARQVDEILRAGAMSGRKGSSAAIQRILKVEPGIERAALWRRLRQLKFPPCAAAYSRSRWSEADDRMLSNGYASGWGGRRNAIRELLRRHPEWRPHTIWKRAAKLRLVEKQPRRGQERSRLRWTERDSQILLNLAGYKTSGTIARVLHRSEAAIRCHLIVLGKSSRAHRDGFSRQELARQLHMGKKTVQKLIVDGLLQVRDPRITRESLDALRNSGYLCTILQHRPSATALPDAPMISTDATGPSSLAGSGSKSRAERVWADVAISTGMPISTVKRLIVRNVLRLYDPTVTEKSVRDFCRHRGALINYEFLNCETQTWLRDSMDLDRAAGNADTLRLKSLRKHAYVVRRCECGRLVRGNVFFRHLKKCSSQNGPIAAKHSPA